MTIRFKVFLVKYTLRKKYIFLFMLSGFNFLLSMFTDKRNSLEIFFNIYFALLRTNYTEAIKSYCFRVMEHHKNTSGQE